jgi:hypothetical protein
MRAFGWICTIIILFLFIPFISFWLSYFGGWITSLVIGDTLCKALNILFNTAYFTKDMIPMMSGALGWIGGFFKSIHSNKK